MRILSDGAEFGETSIWASNVSVTTAQARSGVYSYSITNTFGQLNISALSEFYFRFAMMVNNTWTGAFCSFRYDNNTLCDLLMTGEIITMRVNGATVGTLSQHFYTNIWHLFEIHLKIADSGNFDVKMNGISEVSYSGDTKPGADTSINNFYIGGGPTYYVDDIALNNISGGVDDSWCGDGHYVLLRANAEGDTLQWIPSSGSTHYMMVDDIPPDSDTTYVSASVVGLQDMYNLSAMSPTGNVIKRIWAEGRAKDNTSSAGGIKLGYKTSACTVLSSASIALSGIYTKVLGDYTIINPATSASWTDSDLNSIQFVIECE